MGCINSTKKLSDMRNENVFRVRVVRIQPESPTVRSGFLELNPRELIFDQGREPIVIWALQHLRRYGLNGDVFSFEAGRRCMTGPGIYKFRCQQAERLYQLFQRYVNAVSLVQDEAFTYSDRDRDHPSHTLGRPDAANPHTNNYLEPAPISSSSFRTAAHESFSSSPLSLELDSPNSVPSLSFTNNEVVHFQTHPFTPGAYVNVSSNVYQEHPLRATREHNNNKALAIGGEGGCGSAFSTLSRKTIVKRSSLDVPPEDIPPSAPMLTALHMYANVEVLGSNCTRELDREKLDPTERCYENLSRLDLPLMLQPSQSLQKETAVIQKCLSGGVNYIVLDLDQPRSPAQCSPKTCFGSGLSLEVDRIDGYGASSIADAFSPTSVPTTTISKQDEANIQLPIKTESSLGYSTIDFIKTCALIKSSTHGTDFEHDQEESRITRHSKCVRKAYSISE